MKRKRKLEARNHNILIHGWIEKIEENVKSFSEKESPTDEEKLEFIQHQYHLVMIIYRSLNGQVIFTGAKPI